MFKRRFFYDRKIAFITGAAQGVGKTIAKKLSADGFLVVVADFNLGGAEQTVQEINQSGQAIAVKVDVSKREQMMAAGKKHYKN